MSNIGKDLVGIIINYVSRSGVVYEATITGIPENPMHGYSSMPTVSLEFRDINNKLVRKKRIVPKDNNKGYETSVWFESFCPDDAYCSRCLSRKDMYRVK